MKTMAEPQKVWNKHKITAIVIMLIAIAVVFGIYSTFMESDTSAFNTPNSLEKSISKLMRMYDQYGYDVHVKTVQIDRNENDLIVSFIDERYPDFMGVTIFQREVNNMWHPIWISYGSKPSVDIVRYWDGSKVKTIVYGIDTDPRIASFKGENEQEVIYEQNITEANFIKYYYIENPVDELKFFDADGNDITLELYKELDFSGLESWAQVESGSWFIIFLLFLTYSLFIFLVALIPALFLWTRNKNSIRYYDESPPERKKTYTGFNDRLKNLSVRKKAALIILVISVLTIIILYPFCYSTTLSEDSLTKSVEKYTEYSNVTILKTEMDGDRLIVLFKTEEAYYSPIVFFERGLNGKWGPVGGYAQTGICISVFEKYNYGDSPNSTNPNPVIVTGIECDSRAVSYELVYEHPYDKEKEPITIYGSNITEPNFIHMYETNKNWPIIRNSPTILKIYDSNGENIAPELDEKYWEEKHSHMFRRFMGVGAPVINLIIVFAIIINLITFWAAWIEKPKKKDE